ncbi:MAG: M28 family metallopeptidase [Chitinophagaceae bacterium]|nr:M28 family metallopeptidase [Chitinophagaceae bacterium]
MQKIILPLIVFLFVSVTTLSQSHITGFFKGNVNKQTTLEKQFDSNIDTGRIDAMIKYLSSEPHNLSSARDKSNAEYILNQFKSYGWDAAIETFYVLYPTPKTRKLELISPTKYNAVLKEPAIPEDPTSGEKTQLPPVNVYGADGDVTGDLVFVNYGIPSDYEVLKKMGIDVKGKIVIAKYGHSWRGTKPKVAQEHGAIGCILYSDPADDGYMAGDVYPKGPFKNGFEVQRGSVMDMVLYPGDPLTPGEGATKDAKRLDRKDATTILKIPVLPIGYHDAEPLLRAMSGQNVPHEWQGGLPFAYHMGPGPAKVHLVMEYNWNIVPCYDVIAKIQGSTYPDQWVIRGNHHDAWVHGASDPLSGLSALLEEARSIGIMVKNGWRPKRTLVYCAWDGEEPGLLGSTEWLEEHQTELQQKAVVYINSDNNGRGFLYASGSHALEPFMTEIAKSVTDPQTGVSVFERSKSARVLNAQTSDQKDKAFMISDMKLGAMGSGSDYSSFIQHAGISSLDIGFGGEDRGGEYHTNYDSYSNFIRFKDPGFQYEKALAEVAGRAVLRMSESDILPFRYSHLTNTVEEYNNQLKNLITNKRASDAVQNKMVSKNIFQLANDPKNHFNYPGMNAPVPYLDFSPLDNALQQLKEVTDTLTIKYNKDIAKGKANQPLNNILSHAEQHLLGNGLPLRPWYKHVLYAPGMYTGYGVKTMPGIRESIEQNEWSQAQEQIQAASQVINGFTVYLKGAMN